MTRNDCAAQRPLAEGAVAAESYLSAAPKAPLCKGPARERCLWQMQRLQRPSSRLPWWAATRAGKVSWQPGTVSRQADWGIDAEVYQHRITTLPALRAPTMRTIASVGGVGADAYIGPCRVAAKMPCRFDTAPKTPRRQGERPCRRGAYMGRGAPGTASAYSLDFPLPAEVDFRCPARGRGRPQPSRRIRAAASK